MVSTTFWWWVFTLVIFLLAATFFAFVLTLVWCYPLTTFLGRGLTPTIFTFLDSTTLPVPLLRFLYVLWWSRRLFDGGSSKSSSSSSPPISSPSFSSSSPPLSSLSFSFSFGAFRSPPFLGPSFALTFLPFLDGTSFTLRLLRFLLVLRRSRLRAPRRQFSRRRDHLYVRDTERKVLGLLQQLRRFFQVARSAQMLQQRLCCEWEWRRSVFGEAGTVASWTRPTVAFFGDGGTVA